LTETGPEISRDAAKPPRIHHQVTILKPLAAATSCSLACTSEPLSARTVARSGISPGSSARENSGTFLTPNTKGSTAKSSLPACS
jgi:hypothetical protein